MNAVIYYKGPRGTFSGDWEYVTRVKSPNALYWKEGWKRWLPYADAEEMLVEQGYLKKSGYRWHPATSKKFSYIGPRFAMEAVGVGTILAEIAKAPQERHVVHHSSWLDWREWTMVSEIYDSVQENYPNILLPRNQKQAKNRPIKKLDSARYLGQIWEADPASIVLHSEGVKGVQGGVLYQELQKDMPFWAVLPLRLFKVFGENGNLSIKRYIQKKIEEDGTFCWPGLGTFWLEERHNTQCFYAGWNRKFVKAQHNSLRFRASKQLRDALHNRRDIDTKHPFGGEVLSHRNLHYWVAISDVSTLSRRRRFIYELCDGDIGTMAQMLDRVQIITAVICANLVAQGECSVSGFGRFTVRQRSDGPAVFFKETHRLSSGGLTCGMAGNTVRGYGRKWFEKIHQRYHDIVFSKAGGMSVSVARQIVGQIKLVENPFLVAQITFYLLKSLSSEGRSLSAAAKKIIEQAHQDFAVAPSEQSTIASVTKKKKTSGVKDTKKKEDKVSGKKLVFTGKWTSGTRKEVLTTAEKMGADVVSAVSSVVDYVVAGEKPGRTKINAAKKQGIPIIDEQTWLVWLADAKTVQSKKKKKK